MLLLAHYVCIAALPHAPGPALRGWPAAAPPTGLAQALSPTLSARPPLRPPMRQRRRGSHGGRPLAPGDDGAENSVSEAPETDPTANPQDNAQIWMMPYITPWSDDQFPKNYNAWKTKLETTAMFKKPDYEYRAQFVPGVGSLRPFQRPARAIPPTNILGMLGAGMFGAAFNTGLGLIGMLLMGFACVVHPQFCSVTGSAGDYDPTTGDGSVADPDSDKSP